MFVPNARSTPQLVREREKRESLSTEFEGFSPLSTRFKRDHTHTPPPSLSLTQQRRLCYGTARALDREHTHDRKHSGRCRGESLLEHTLWQKQHETTSHPHTVAEAARNHFTSTKTGRGSTKPPQAATTHTHKSIGTDQRPIGFAHSPSDLISFHSSSACLLTLAYTYRRARASLSSNEAHIIVQPKRLLRRRARPAIPYSFVVGVRLSRVGPSSSKRQTHALFRNNRNEVSSERATDTLSTLTQLVQHPFLIRSSRTCFAHTARELARVANEHVHTRPRTRNEGTHPKSWR